jgi:hypothetical protein
MLKRSLAALLIVPVVISLSASAAVAQDLPNLSKYEVLGVAGNSAFLAADVDLEDSDLRFTLLIAEAQMDEDGGLHLNKDQYTVLMVKADCREMSYRILADNGVRDGQPYKGKKGDKQKPDPRSNIAQVLKRLCTPPPISSAPRLEAE